MSKLAEWFGMKEREVEHLRTATRSQAEFIDAFFARYCQLRGKRRWAEKTPRNIAYLDYIVAHFRKASIIHLIRDGRDVVCSLRTHPRSKIVHGKPIPLNTCNPMDRCVERWVHDVSAGLRYRTHPKYMEVKYEDLVDHPEMTIRKVLKFIGEQYEEEIMEYHKAEGPSRDKKYFDHSSDAIKPIHRQSIGRWKLELSDSEKKLFMARGGSLMKELGYE
jgi:hypothetical protein